MENWRGHSGRCALHSTRQHRKGHGLGRHKQLPHRQLHPRNACSSASPSPPCLPLHAPFPRTHPLAALYLHPICVSGAANKEAIFKSIGYWFMDNEKGAHVWHTFVLLNLKRSALSDAWVGRRCAAQRPLAFPQPKGPSYHCASVHSPPADCTLSNKGTVGGSSGSTGGSRKRPGRRSNPWLAPATAFAGCLPQRGAASGVPACRPLHWRVPDTERRHYSCPSYGLGLVHGELPPAIQALRAGASADEARALLVASTDKECNGKNGPLQF